jgi:hypothetical protein
VATIAAVTVTIGLWAVVVAATAKHLKLTPPVRAFELLAGPVVSTAVALMASASIIWTWAAQASVSSLVLAIVLLVQPITYAPKRIQQAARKGRRLRAAASRGR